ncbi:MAG: hypothetical protein A2283_04515 [Lentisphaerae bacterium RIFOXYA12_FULL_48_11]|nr:MAG: hypothetical protein A2283_04515 [Lentisphaerae bacterium RIFOXYA12_FULL_48_11]
MVVVSSFWAVTCPVVFKHEVMQTMAAMAAVVDKVDNNCGKAGRKEVCFVVNFIFILCPVACISCPADSMKNFCKVMSFG